jgi:Protein of unknown function (DUF2800)
MKRRTMQATAHDKEAEFLPSASGFDSEFRCLGRRALTNKLPKEEDTAIQVRGTKIHKALEDSDLEDLADSDARTASRCMYAEAKLVNEFDFEGAEVSWEARYWDFDDDFKHTWSARIDTLHLKPTRLLVADNKTGWGIPPPIEVNWQVRASAALLADSYYDVDEAIVALIHPHHPDSLYEVRAFSRSELSELLVDVRGFVKAIQQPDQPRTAGSIQCQFCMAKRVCPEYKAHMTAIEQAIADEIADEGFTGLIRQSPSERGDMVSHLKEMTKNIQVLMKQYVEMAKHDEMAVKGYTLKRRMLRSFTDEGEGMRLIREEWGEDALADATHVSLPDLEKVLAKRLGTSTEARAAVKRVLNPVLKFKTTEAYLDESRSL